MNFLFIFTDQQRVDHLSCYNNNMVLRTPYIDSIAKNGIKFTRFYCNNPICMPNRSTIFTGQYPSVHGVTTNGRKLPQGTRTFTDILLESGYYHTASFGKIHLNYFGFPIKKFNKQTESQEYSQHWDYHKLTNYSPYFGLEEIKLVCGHGTLCGHPDYFNWVKSKMDNDDKLCKLFRMKPTTSDATLQDRINWSFKTKGSFLKLQVLRHKVPEELYSTTFVKENTINFLERFANGEYSKNNFFTFCSFPDPHHPYTPPGKYFGMYDPEDIILPKSFNDKHEKSPEFMKIHYNETLHTEGTTKGLFPSPKDVTELDAKRVIAASYGMEKMIDDAVGEILDVLDKTGLAKNTIVIYTTDHGELGGDHHFFFKGPYLYQGLVNIPFLIKIPNGLENKETTSLASSIDIPETILELARFPIPDSMQGKSLVPILKKPDTKIHDSILIEMDDEITINEQSRTLITEDWRITVFSEAYIGQLFNLKEDPDEMNNLWNNQSFGDKKSELLLKLMRKNTEDLRNPVIRDCQF